MIWNIYCNFHGIRDTHGRLEEINKSILMITQENFFRGFKDSINNTIFLRVDIWMDPQPDTYESLTFILWNLPQGRLKDPG